MPNHTFGPRRFSRSVAVLDFGLRVRLEVGVDQRTIFSGAENMSAQELTSELSEMVSQLRVRSFAMRGHLEEVASALMTNVRSGFWPLARRAALDLAGLLDLARRRHLADAELCIRGAGCASRIAELCGRVVR